MRPRPARPRSRAPRSGAWAPSLALGLAAWLAAGLGAPGRAHAWTDAQVRTVKAEVRVDAAARAEVQLAVEVRVRGGWLEGLEVAGLDPELALDEESLRFVSVQGERFRPRVRVREGGRVQLRFERREAPRRGTYEVRFRYRSDLAPMARPTEDGERVRVEWTLPGWEAGLDGVELTLDVPGDAAFPPEDDALATIHRSRETGEGRSRLSWRRAHLPRTLPWTVAAEVPAEAMASALSQREAEPVEPAASAAPLAAPAPADAQPGWGRQAATLLVVLFALWVLALFELGASRRRARSRPWLPLPARLRALGVLGLALVALSQLEEGWRWLGALAGTLLFVAQRPARASVPRLGGWVPCEGADLERARGEVRALAWKPEAFADATRAAGLALLLGGTLALARVAELDRAAGLDDAFVGLAWWILPALLLVATRQRLPATPAERLLTLAARARTLRLPPGLALRLVVHRDADARWQDARLRLITRSRIPGVLRLDLVAAERPGPGGWERCLAGLVVTREGTPADAAVAATLEAPGRRGPGGRVARLVSLPELCAAAATIDVRGDRDEASPPRRRRTRRPAPPSPRPADAP
ncbi:MAG TPA: hypothetical protein RMH85_00745 [Polyangiaceae bacterium LLY-WYZ-15_(1-7)]|nr:hypothetical protein [Polyangiaceae bacterium LLY-WYZ-15_(1-7)]HJL06988.1 hypothetical protein [Polyangiaceae bacterium LLY-WYZ-15_(1-7)]HJL21700.1 hypothetical protein [Polyangiaceae bacterium LLY-WYZ-15_(1-7)]